MLRGEAQRKRHGIKNIESAQIGRGSAGRIGVYALLNEFKARAEREVSFYPSRVGNMKGHIVSLKQTFNRRNRFVRVAFVKPGPSLNILRRIEPVESDSRRSAKHGGGISSEVVP